jgi:hypothetical protein
METVDRGFDVDRLEAGPSELSAMQRRGLLRVLLVGLALVAAVVVTGSVSLLDSGSGQSQTGSTPTETAKPIVLDAAEGSLRDVKVSILDRQRADRDVLPGWVAAQVSAGVAESARLAITHDEVQVFIAGIQSSPCLLAVDRAAHRILGDCATDIRFVASSGDDWMSVSAIAVDCSFDVVLVPDDYQLKTPRGATVSTVGPNVAVVPSTDRLHTYGLKSRGQNTVPFTATGNPQAC